MNSNATIRVAMVSLGCPKNLVDSEKMLALLAGDGCLVAAPPDAADVIVINTCGFLSAARDESLEAIREAVAMKRRGPARRVVVAGCLVNRDGDGLYREAPGIDAIVGVNDREAIAGAVLGRRRITRLTPHAAKIASDAGRFRLTPRHTAYLRISEGCSHHCTFCTIPAIRGPFRSKSPAAVLAEARELADDGAIELNVIGQDTTAYGGDMKGRCNLAALLRQLDAMEAARWIRLLYTHPRRLSAELIETIASCRRVVPYVDVPLQHISDPILRRMARRVTRKTIEARLGLLRRCAADAVIRTTFIVGFPGESERQFEELLEFVEDFRFDAMGVFEFSPEPGTPAARMPGQVDAETKARRLERLMLAQQKIAFAANRRKVGRPIEVLVDGTDARGRCVGRYFGQAPDIDGVCLLRRDYSPGTFVRAEVTGWDGYDLVVG